jgi:hypothetical protein
MTNKIIFEALKLAGFQNSTSIAEILNHVPNRNVALEMLLGVYEPIDLIEFGIFWKGKYSSENYLIKIESIDELSNKVHYSKFKYKTKTVYYLTEEDRKKDVYVTEKPEKYYTTGNVRINGYTVETDCSDISHFGSTYVKSEITDEDFIYECAIYEQPEEESSMTV